MQTRPDLLSYESQPTEIQGQYNWRVGTYNQVDIFCTWHNTAIAATYLCVLTTTYLCVLTTLTYILCHVEIQRFGLNNASSYLESLALPQARMEGRRLCFKCPVIKTHNLSLGLLFFCIGALFRCKGGPPVLEEPAWHLPRQGQGFVRPLVCPTPPAIRGASGGQLTDC